MNKKVENKQHQIILSAEDEEKRQSALKKANDAYNDMKSPHFRDNERYSWAVETINRKFFGDNHL